MRGGEFEDAREEFARGEAAEVSLDFGAEARARCGVGDAEGLIGETDFALARGEGERRDFTAEKNRRAVGPRRAPGGRRLAQLTLDPRVLALREGEGLGLRAAARNGHARGAAPHRGCHLPRRVDARVISATNANLTEEVANGRFREECLNLHWFTKHPIPVLWNEQHEKFQAIAN